MPSCRLLIMYQIRKILFAVSLTLASISNASAAIGVINSRAAIAPRQIDSELMQDLRSKAEAGQAESQTNLGYVYLNGIGVPSNSKLAADWFMKAADQGAAVAQFNLGVLYENGIGVAKDNAIATEWYDKAAAQGYAPAIESLGTIFELGRGVPKNQKIAFDYHKKAAELGLARAQTNVGRAFVYGLGVKQDYAAALDWYRKAVTNGDSFVFANIGWLYEKGWGVAKDNALAVGWYTKGAVQGDPSAQLNLAFMYWNGRGVSKDSGAAIEWIRKAALQGHAEAQFNLGEAYRIGDGIEKDEVKAVGWYNMAAEQGYPEAQYKMGFMYENGLGVARDVRVAADWIRKANERMAAEGGFEIANKVIEQDNSERKQTNIFIDASILRKQLDETDLNNANESKLTDGTLSAELIITDDHKKLLAVWNGPDENVKLPQIDSTQQGKPAHAFVIFSGCKLNKNGRCTVSLSYQVYAPDGTLLTLSPTQFPLNNALADGGLTLSYSGPIVVTEKESVGRYMVKARLRDLNSDSTLDLRKVLTVTPK